MPLFRVAAAALAVLALPLGGGIAAEGRADAAPDNRNTVQLGPVLGDPEKGSGGPARGPGDECGRVPFFSRDAALHGPRIGNPEKGSFGFHVAGQYDSCDGTVR